MSLWPRWRPAPGSSPHPRRTSCSTGGCASVRSTRPTCRLRTGRPTSWSGRTCSRCFGQPRGPRRRRRRPAVLLPGAGTASWTAPRHAHPAVRHPRRGFPTGFVSRTWSPVNSPVLDVAGRAVGVLHHVEDITGLDRLVADRGPHRGSGKPGTSQPRRRRRRRGAPGQARPARGCSRWPVTATTCTRCAGTTSG